MLEMWMKKDIFYGFTLLASSEVSVCDLGTTGAPHLLWGAEGPQEAPEALDHRGGGSVTEASSTVYRAKRPRTTEEGPRYQKLIKTVKKVSIKANDVNIKANNVDIKASITVRQLNG